MRRAVVTAIGTYTPANVVTNFDLAERLDTSDEWIKERTLISERHLCTPEETTSTMCIAAALEAVAERGLDPKEIDLVIVATVTPDMLFPSTSNLVQEGIGAANAGAMDILAACPGFIYALATATAYVQSGLHRRVLVCGGDKMSAIVDWSDRRTAVIFGDGAGAFIVEADEDGYGVHDVILGSDGSGAKYLYMKAGGSLHPASHETVDAGMHFIRMDGRKVYMVGIRRFTSLITDICARNGLVPTDIHCHLIHQANGRIVQEVIKRLGLDPARCPININRYGNTTDATIPLVAADARRDGLLQDGNWVLMTSFGAGFGWGSILAKWRA
ncbi:ketoacyl-ACP synthase III [bacterium]|nr:ketoacyl-ACP synthase III [bacterium]